MVRVTDASGTDTLEVKLYLGGTTGPVKLTKQIGVPRKLTSLADIDALIQQLQEVKAQLSHYAEAEITIVVGETAR